MTMPSSSQPPAGGMVYCITQNPGVFASNYIPLWAGLTEMNPDMGAAAVTSLNNSGLIQPGGEELVGVEGLLRYVLHAASTIF